jgi:hypothetical protein
VLTNIYQLNLLVNGKLVQFSMNVDESLKIKNKVDDMTVCKWRTRLEAIANNMFKEK